MLMTNYCPGERVQGHKERHPLDDEPAGRQESLPGHRLHRCREAQPLVVWSSEKDKLDSFLHALLKILSLNHIFSPTLVCLVPVFRIRILTDPHKEMPPGSGSACTDADRDPDPGGKKA